MKYQFNEGSLELPDASENKTLHMLILDPGTELSFSMIVSGFIAGETPAQFVDRQMKTLSRQLSKFKETSRESIKLANPADPDKPINALLLETQFKQGDKSFYQRQCVALMDDGKHALVLTANSHHPFAEREIKIWETAYTTITFRKPNA
jgi:hypothetical protein